MWENLTQSEKSLKTSQ